MLDGIPDLNLKPTNPMWRFYELNQSDRAAYGLTGLEAYLPSNQPDGNGNLPNRDIGRFEPADQTMRFGAKHNDIFPLLGDMIRWRLKMPSRHASMSDDAVAD